MKGIKYIFLGTVLLTGIQVFLDLKTADPAGQHARYPELVCTAILPVPTWMENPSDEIAAEFRDPNPSPFPGGKSTVPGTNHTKGPALRKLLDPLTLDRPPPPNQG